MKLYYDPHAEPGARWLVPGKQPKKAGRVDVPANPDLLADWLNGRQVLRDAWSGAGVTITAQLANDPRWVDRDSGELYTGEHGTTPLKPKVAGFCDACGRSAAGTLKLAQGEDIETVLAWVTTAELWQLQRVAEGIREHVAELGEQIEGSTVQ
jgi:hypothetical protein